MATFVTLDQAKRRLRVTSMAEDEDIQDLVDQAEAHVIGWCSRTPRSKAVAETWLDVDSVPKVVVAAILVQLSELWRFRGDDLDGPLRPTTDTLSADMGVLVRELLRPYHDPVVG